ncbi:hypothetical protein [Kitasatospora sp. NPDC089509]|uniref:hypothetical protein n=1 Tax=Kitasatospora sp. NPDC089509 TaxID=3364079 RepID=UPI003802C7B2
MDTPSLAGSEFAITNLAPQSQPPYGGSVTLTWHGPAPGTTAHSYFLQRSDHVQNLTPITPTEDAQGVCSHIEPDITQTVTAFLVIVKGPNHQEARAITTVVLERGDVHAGALSATGVTRLLNPKPPTFFEKDTQTNETYSAPTDGFLAATVTTVAQKTVAKLHVTITDTGHDPRPPLRSTLIADRAQIPINTLLPVHADALVTLQVEGSSPKASATWFPLGRGELTPHIT